MAEGHRSKSTSWATVVVIVVSAVLLGFALPMHSMILAVFGIVVGLVGVVMAVAFRIMDDFH